MIDPNKLYTVDTAVTGKIVTRVSPNEGEDRAEYPYVISAARFRIKASELKGEAR